MDEIYYTYPAVMTLFIKRYSRRNGVTQDDCMFDTREVKDKMRPLFLRPDIQIVFEHFIMGFCAAGGVIK